MAISKASLGHVKATLKVFQRNNTKLVNHQKVLLDGVDYKSWVRDFISSNNINFYQDVDGTPKYFSRGQKGYAFYIHGEADVGITRIVNYLFAPFKAAGQIWDTRQEGSASKMRRS